jgi:hypothetical protein
VAGHRCRSLLLALALVPLALGVRVAQAKDLCINTSVYGETIVGPGVTIPSKGKCKPFAGFMSNQSFSGAVCASSDGTLVHFTLHDGYLTTTVLDMNLPLPTSTVSNAAYCHADVGGPYGNCMFGGITASVGYCTTKIPVM